MVGRHDEEQRIGICITRVQRCGHDGRRGVSGHRFQDDRRLLDANLPKLFSDNEAMLVVRDDHDRVELRRICNPQRGLLQHRLAARERVKLLGETLP